MKGYWDKAELDGRFATQGFTMALPGRIALILIEKWGVVTGKVRGEEDSAGRAVLDVMPVEDVVKRAFDMAEQATNELERREWIRSVDMTPEQVGESMGRIQQAMYDTRFADRRTSSTPKP